MNLAFTLERNLIDLPSLRIGGREGRFILGTAARRTAIDPSFSGARRTVVQMGERESRRIEPVSVPLGGVADAIVGADVWGRNSISIDYRSGLVTLQKYPIRPGYMTVFRFEAEPMINLEVDGRLVSAIVDTTSPDTLILPGSAERRGTARVTVAGIDFGAVDVRYDAVSEPRIGNRLLVHFLVTIDYGRRLVGLWRDPRIPVTAP